jgi:trimethylamine:corrinoid methyltransferase-like protein
LQQRGFDAGSGETPNSSVSNLVALDGGPYEALQEVDPSGHFFATTQTMGRYNTEFYEPIVHDYANFGKWTERGALGANERATGVWERILAGRSGT